MDALIGYTAGDWWKLMRENHFAFSGTYLNRVAIITIMSFMNSRDLRKENKNFGSEVEKTRIENPLFILGHWRAGTTLLHTLLALDDQFCYPNLFEVTYPHTFLLKEPIAEQRFASAPPRKRPMDNMEVTFQSPGEDEPALAVMDLCSPLIGWSFPRREEFYDRFITFHQASEKQITRWEQAVMGFMQKLSFRYKKPILLKSPAHTGRIRLILKLFPDARFLHIHRNPYTVFKSTQHLYATAVPNSYLQKPSPRGPDEGILRRYKAMYDAFFEDRDLIPAGHFYEVCFEDLEKDKVGEVARIYESLKMPGYARLEPKLQEYVASLADYKKNSHSPIPENLRARVAEEWRSCFDEWNYPV